MHAVDKDTAYYVIAYFGELMTDQERRALRHIRSTFKLEGDKNQRRTNVYYKTGWLSTDPEVLALLSDGPDQFMITCAERILKDNPGKVFLNHCPKCGKLTRTPQAKQCRFCGEDWH